MLSAARRPAGRPGGRAGLRPRLAARLESPAGHAVDRQDVAPGAQARDPLHRLTAGGHRQRRASRGAQLGAMGPPVGRAQLELDGEVSRKGDGGRDRSAGRDPERGGNMNGERPAAV